MNLYNPRKYLLNSDNIYFPCVAISVDQMLDYYQIDVKEKKVVILG